MIRLKAERLKRNWSQQDLGYHARMAGADISRIERGWMKPYPGQAKRLAKVLKISGDKLLDEVGISESVEHA